MRSRTGSDRLPGMSDLGHDADMAVDVILRDGTTLRLRAPVESDVPALVAFFATLSVRSRFLRFHGLALAGDRFVRTLVSPDWAESGSLIGVMGDVGGGERIVAVGNYVRLRDPHTAEAAFAVADDFQRKGIGTRLLEQLAQRAAAHGIEGFIAEVLPENQVMLSVFENIGFRATRTLDGGVVEVRFPIEATEGYQARVDERDHVAVTASLRPFFAPSTVAVVGASARRGSIGGELFRNVLAGGFTGAAYPVNRSGEPVAGVRAYSSIDEIADPVDLCVICLPGDHVIDAAEAALRTGTRALCVISAGFAETGPDGVDRQERLLTLVRAYGARLIGPNCLGIASAAVGLNATFAPRAFPAGRIGFSSQSGALGLALLERAEARGLGLSAFVSIGNKADVSSNDLLEWWEDDAGTDLVLLYVESFGNPRKFSRIARRLAREKPVLAMKSGRSQAGQKAAGSHTAALAGSDTAVDAVFRQAGVIRADTLAGLLDVAALLSCQPVPRGTAGRGADECRRARDPLRRRLRGGRVRASAARRGDACGPRRRASGRGVGREPRRHARLRHRGALPARPCRCSSPTPASTRSSPCSCRPRRRRGSRRRRGDQPRDGRGRSAGQARARRHPRRDGRAGDAALRRHHPFVLLSGGRRRALGRAVEYGEWLRRSAGTVPEIDRHRHCSGRGGDRDGARARRRGMARPGRDAPAARRIRHPARRRAPRRHARGGGRCGRRARLPRRRQDGRGGGAQDGDRRRRARPRRRRRRAEPRPSASACP